MFKKKNLESKIEQEREKFQLDMQKALELQKFELQQRENMLLEREENLEGSKDNSKDEFRTELLGPTIFVTNGEQHTYEHTDEYEVRIREIREEVNRVENENFALQLLLRKKEEDMEIQQNRQVELENALDEFREELDNKEQQITNYSIQIMNKDAQLLNRRFSFFSKAPTLDLQQELERTLHELQEKTAEISRLNQTLKRITEEKRSELNAKKRTLLHYEKLVSETRKKYSDLKDEIMLVGIKKNERPPTTNDDDVLSHVTKEFLEEHETLKRKYFFTLAVAIKLTRSQKGRSTNVDVHSLYETGKNLPFVEWDEWIQQQLEKPA